MLIDAYASLPHYRHHIEPVWRALGPAAGQFAGRCGDGPARWRRGRPTLVASWSDARRAGTPFVYLEHGAGQSYDGDERSAAVAGYSGAAGLEGCMLFLCPNERVAARWRRAYPGARAEVVGCPRLDECVARARQMARPPGPPRVAFSFHWECGLIPEARSAWAHYARGMPAAVAALRTAGVEPVGHGHPRDRQLLPRRWARLGVPYWPDSERVLLEADALACDNSSLMWEMAALGKPLVVLDAPWYRRDVEHGLRFWEHADAGIRVGDAADLAGAALAALADPEPQRGSRAAAAAAAYSGLDGACSERAAAAILRAADETGEP